MRSRSRLITKELKASDFICSFELNKEEEIRCYDCGDLIKPASEGSMIGSHSYCVSCSPWHKQQREYDRIAIEQDLLRSAGRKSVEELEAELDRGERDYWD